MPILETVLNQSQALNEYYDYFSIQEEYSNEIQLLCKELMPTLVQILQNSQLFEDTKFGIHIISSFIGLLDCIQDEQFSLYMSMDNFPSAEELEDFMTQMFNVFSLLLDNSIYPVDWMIVQLRKDFILLTKISSISDALDLEVCSILYIMLIASQKYIIHHYHNAVFLL